MLRPTSKKEEEVTVEVSVFDMNGDGSVDKTEIYKCPSGKRATLRVLFYLTETSNVCSITLNDPLVDDSYVANINLDELSAVSGWYRLGANTSFPPWSSDFIKIGSSAYAPERQLLYSGQSVDYQVFGSSLWRLILEITEEDV
jgi:hypothetical protein